MPANTYQSAYEATYHMYLSAIHGKIDEQTVDYIEKEKQYIQSVENQIELDVLVESYTSIVFLLFILFYSKMYKCLNMHSKHHSIPCSNLKEPKSHTK